MSYLIPAIIWCFNKLQPKDKVDLICKMIIFAQEDEKCQEVIYLSCSNCPGKIPKGRGIRALGFKEQ